MIQKIATLLLNMVAHVVCHLVYWVRGFFLMFLIFDYLTTRQSSFELKFRIVLKGILFSENSKSLMFNQIFLVDFTYQIIQSVSELDLKWSFAIKHSSFSKQGWMPFSISSISTPIHEHGKLQIAIFFQTN
ncbi:unnamed protein product [Brugia pahangi]|uniref:MATH domain-containing protein n=1 Tax=Brugia pahangi TaxID=6280 RepID=A0A0N4TNC2_BRUPA|nr:unnamed protein product [Brugia pahangi]